MKKIQWTRHAREKLGEIRAYSLDNWGEAQAQKYVAQLRHAIREIAARDILVYRSFRGYFHHRVNKHHIIWRETETTVQIISFIGDGQDWDRAFSQIVQRFPPEQS